MAKRSGPSMLKRQKEMARRQKQQDKDARRKAAREPGEPGEAGEPQGEDEDPDIAGIVPGPQPVQPE